MDLYYRNSPHLLSQDTYNADAGGHRMLQCPYVSEIHNIYGSFPIN